MNPSLSPFARLGTLAACLHLTACAAIAASPPPVDAGAAPRTVYEIWEPRPAPNRGPVAEHDLPGRGYSYDIDWERWSYPLGNGTIGANIFGRTDVERIQLSEKTFANGSAYGRGGVTNAAEIYLDLGHEDIRD